MWEELQLFFFPFYLYISQSCDSQGCRASADRKEKTGTSEDVPFYVRERAEAGVRGREVWDGLKEVGSRAAESQDKSPHHFVCMSVLSGYVWSRRKTEFSTQLRNLAKISQTCAISLHALCRFYGVYAQKSNWGGRFKKEKSIFLVCYWENLLILSNLKERILKFLLCNKFYLSFILGFSWNFKNSNKLVHVGSLFFKMYPRLVFI